MTYKKNDVVLGLLASRDVPEKSDGDPIAGILTLKLSSLIEKRYPRKPKAKKVKK